MTTMTDTEKNALIATKLMGLHQPKLENPRPGGATHEGSWLDSDGKWMAWGIVDFAAPPWAKRMMHEVWAGDDDGLGIKVVCCLMEALAPGWTQLETWSFSDVRRALDATGVDLRNAVAVVLKEAENATLEQ